jgi:hypothetical protein
LFAQISAQLYVRSADRLPFEPFALEADLIKASGFRSYDFPRKEGMYHIRLGFSQVAIPELHFDLNVLTFPPDARMVALRLPALQEAQSDA